MDNLDSHVAMLYCSNGCVFLSSGRVLTVLDADEFEGKPAKAVKQALAAKVGISRFKQRFCAEESCGVLGLWHARCRCIGKVSRAPAVPRFDIM